MGLVVADISISLDGYVTGPNDSRSNPFGDGAGMLHDWFGDAATDEDRAVLRELMDSVGAVVMGRTSFEKNEGDGGWGDAGPAGAAGDKIVSLFGATVMQQSLPLGLLDEIRVHVAATLIGGGTPLFGALDTGISLERTQAVITPAATHLTYRVLR